MHLDTSFLIDLQREIRRGQHGECHRFLRVHEDRILRISSLVAMEYLEGFPDVQTEAASRFLSTFQLVPVGFSEASVASRIRRSLRLSGQLLPDADILIAACALATNEPLVTNNPDHFARIKGLIVLTYT